MEPKEEKIHVLACPAARRAIRGNDQSVMWCIRGILNVLDSKCDFAKTKQPDLFTPRITFTADSDFIITTLRSKLYNDELVLFISQYHGLWDTELQWFVSKCKPISLI